MLSPVKSCGPAGRAFVLVHIPTVTLTPPATSHSSTFTCAGSRSASRALPVPSAKAPISNSSPGSSRPPTSIAAPLPGGVAGTLVRLLAKSHRIASGPRNSTENLIFVTLMERHFARAAVEIVTDSSADQSLATASKSPYMTRAGGATPRLGFQFRMGKQADSSATLINLTQVADFAYIPTSPDESSYRRPRSNRRPILSWRRIGHLGGSGSAALLLVTIVVLSCVIIHLKRRDAQSFIEELHTTGDSLWAAMPDPLAAMLDRGEGAIASKLTDTSAAGVANVDAGLDKENRRPSKLHYFTHATPQEKFWDQLRPGRRYLTAFTFGGHSNQMLGIQKLLYLAKVTSRVPIVPTMIPDHFAGFPADFTKFYDLDRFYRETGIPAFVMSGIKPGDNNWQSQPIEEIAREHLGCWSVQEAVVGYANGFGHTLVHHNFGVNLWALPELTKAIGGNEIAFDAMRMFDFDKLARSTWLDKVKREMLPQKETEAILPITDSEGRANNTKDTFNPVSGVLPNDKVLCFDNTMFLGAIEFSEEEEVEQGRSVPQPEPRLTGEDITWQEVGQHIFFNTEVREMASKYLVHLFEVASPAEMPPYISVHLRRGDFAAFAGGYTKLEGYLMGIKRIQAKLQSRIDDLQSWQSPGKRHFKPRSGSKVIDFPIVATTDEDMGSDLVRQIRGLGWKVVDHDAMQTIETKGPWWLTVLDMAILAGGSGFIGTERSTYSYMTGLRVKYWQGGVVDFAGDNLQAVDLKALLREYEDREAAKEAKAMAKALQP